MYETPAARYTPRPAVCVVAHVSENQLLPVLYVPPETYCVDVLTSTVPAESTIATTFVTGAVVTPRPADSAEPAASA